jgi:hypothetical protein
MGKIRDDSRSKVFVIIIFLYFRLVKGKNERCQRTVPQHSPSYLKTTPHCCSVRCCFLHVFTSNREPFPVYCVVFFEFLFFCPVPWIIKLGTAIISTYVFIYIPDVNALSRYCPSLRYNQYSLAFVTCILSSQCFIY